MPPLTSKQQRRDKRCSRGALRDLQHAIGLDAASVGHLHPSTWASEGPKHRSACASRVTVWCCIAGKPRGALQCTASCLHTCGHNPDVRVVRATGARLQNTLHAYLSSKCHQSQPSKHRPIGRPPGEHWNEHRAKLHEGSVRTG